MAKRGRKPGDMTTSRYLPNTRQGFGETEEDKALVRKLLTEVYISYKMPRVKSDDELAERLDIFFENCAKTGKIPTVEEMCMCIGYTYSGWHDIEFGRRPGFSPETKVILRRAKEFLKTFDAKLVLTGEVNPIVYFFRAKNYYGMRDQQEVVVQANAEDERKMSTEDIAKWYLDNGKTVETTFKDDSGSDS